MAVTEKYVSGHWETSVDRQHSPVGKTEETAAED